MNRREALAAGAIGLTAVAAAAAERRPHQPQGWSEDHQARNLPRPAALAVPQGPHRRRHRRPGRADRRGPGRDRRRRGQGDRAVPRRQGPAAGRAPLAGDLPPRLLPRRPGPDQRPERHRHGPLGHQGQGARRAGLRAARRPDAHEGPRLRPRPHAGRDQARASPRGFTAFKTGPAVPPPVPRYVETPAQVRYAVEQFAALRKAAGDDVDIAIDFHGEVSPAMAKLLIKALEPYQPMFIEEPINCQNHDVMAEIARGTHLPIATGERVFTKWGFREVLEKKAATILQPDLCHAGGITEVRLIAGMAEAYYAAIAPHNPLGPISLAAGIQLAASIPNFLCQEQVSLGEGYLKTPFVVQNGLRRPADRPGPGHRARRGRAGRQDRPRLEEPRATTRTTARWSIGEAEVRDDPRMACSARQLAEKFTSLSHQAIRRQPRRPVRSDPRPRTVSCPLKPFAY